MLKVLLCFLFSTLLCSEWKELDKDLLIKSISLKSSFLPNELILIKSKLKDITLSVVSTKELGKDRMYAEEVVKKQKALVGINANYFDEYGKPLGLVISKGVQKNKIHKYGDTLTGIFYLNRSEFKIIDKNNWYSGLGYEAIQSGPRLVKDNQIVDSIKNSDTKSRRSGICITNSNELILFITSGILGFSLSELQKLTSEIGCKDVINLDGGGSSQLYVSEKNFLNQEISVPGRDPVPVVILLSKN